MRNLVDCKSSSSGRLSCAASPEVGGYIRKITIVFRLSACPSLLTAIDHPNLHGKGCWILSSAELAQPQLGRR